MILRTSIMIETTVIRVRRIAGYAPAAGNNITEPVRIRNLGGEGAFRLIISEEEPPEDYCSGVFVKDFFFKLPY